MPPGPRQPIAPKQPRITSVLAVWLTAAWLLSPISAFFGSVGPVSFNSRHGLFHLNFLIGSQTDHAGFHIGAVRTERPEFNFWEWRVWWDAPFTPSGIGFLTFPFWLLLLPFVLWISIRALRDRRGSLTGHCPHCRYDLIGNTSGVCPECGAPTTQIETCAVDEQR